jgi:hypothetical protein
MRKTDNINVNSIYHQYPTLNQQQLHQNANRIVSSNQFNENGINSIEKSSFTKFQSDIIYDNKYWKNPTLQNLSEDIVVIHVCDENQQISKDFCCKRNILVRHCIFHKIFQLNISIEKKKLKNFNCFYKNRFKT